MTAGIPGTGISVLFYLLSMMVMFVDSSLSVMRTGSHAGKRKIAKRQLGILGGATVAFCLTSWLLHWMLIRFQSVNLLSFRRVDNWALPLHPWLIGISILMVLLLVVELLSVCASRQQSSAVVTSISGPHVRRRSLLSFSTLAGGEDVCTSPLIWIALPMLTLLVAVATRSHPPVHAGNQILTYRTEAFFDTFDGNLLNTKNWLVAYKQWGGEDANGGVVPDNVHVADGKLIIAAHGNRYQGPVRGINRDLSHRSDGKRVGGAIATRNYFASGRYEVRMKVVPEYGAASAIWTLNYAEYYRGEPQYVDKPMGSPDYYAVNHEIDVEIPGRPGRDHSNIDFTYALFTTWVGENSDEHTVNYANLGAPQNDGRFHTYRFDWHTGSDTQKKRVEFYVDNQLQQITYTHIPKNASRLWIGVWFPRSWAGTPDFDTAYLEVDWVRITPFDEDGDTWHTETFPNEGWAQPTITRE